MEINSRMKSIQESMNYWHRNRLQSMTSNGVMAVILHYFTEMEIFWANYPTVVKVSPCFRKQKCSSKNAVFGNQWRRQDLLQGGAKIKNYVMGHSRRTSEPGAADARWLIVLWLMQMQCWSKELRVVDICIG